MGGSLHFGPDGYLYIGMGDGGSAGDPYGNAQDSDTLLGSMLRIDVLTNLNGYSIPDGHPYGTEICSIGLRNPWQYSFDYWNDDLWIGDVGQSAWEEVNRTSAYEFCGYNYGWDCMEGNHSYDSCSLSDAEHTAPLAEFSHSSGLENYHSIVGGFVYRGDDCPELFGYYIVRDSHNNDIYAVGSDGTKISLDGVMMDMRSLFCKIKNRSYI